MQLSDEEREMLIDILQKRQIETRRDEIARNAQEALEAFRAGKLQPEAAETLIARLHASLRQSMNERFGLDS
jgi:hypothetical protein